MTLSATYSILYQARETGRLVARPPLVQKVPIQRALYVTPNVLKGLAGDDPDLSHLPMVEMEGLIANFCFGWYVTVSLNGDPNQKRPDMERLRTLDEVWVLCARKPSNTQVRLFGRFIDVGVFIGLGLHCRQQLGGYENYEKVAARVPELWSSTVGNVEPFRASIARQYLTGICRDVDEEPI